MSNVSRIVIRKNGIFFIKISIVFDWTFEAHLEKFNSKTERILV